MSVQGYISYKHKKDIELQRCGRLDSDLKDKMMADLSTECIFFFPFRSTEKLFPVLYAVHFALLYERIHDVTTKPKAAGNGTVGSAACRSLSFCKGSRLTEAIPVPTRSGGAPWAARPTPSEERGGRWLMGFHAGIPPPLMQLIGSQAPHPISMILLSVSHVACAP